MSPSNSPDPSDADTPLQHSGGKPEKHSPATSSHPHSSGEAKGPLPTSPSEKSPSPRSPYHELRVRELQSDHSSEIAGPVPTNGEKLSGGRPEREPISRRVTLPSLLFLATCLSTFWVGAAEWEPLNALGNGQLMWRTISTNWLEGLTYMGAVLAILLTHEMGHFLQTVRHHIPASYPLCIPVPFNPIGTMGAVISMDGMRADRKQIFDIGLAGPLAGLAVAIPILWIGVEQIDLSRAPRQGEILLNSPLIVQWMMGYLHPEWVVKSEWIGISQVNPWFMAGWVGMLITGLNMLPISQLDGGHTLYGLFGRRAHSYARAFVMLAIGYVVINLEQAAIWTPMLILVILMGIHHPPTANDRAELDNFRWLLGIASLSIPIICFPLLGLKQ